MKKIIIIVICLLLCGCQNNNTSSEKREKKKINCTQKEELMMEKENVIIIDVRTPEEFAEGHIDKAINIEYDEIIDGVKNNQEITKDTHIIVYCRSGNRSSIAQEKLIEAGFKNTYDLGAMSNCINNK